MNTMKAAVWHGRKDIRLEQVNTPNPPQPGWVTIKVAYCGICGSDMGEYLNGPQLITPNTIHPLSQQTTPLTLGHEFSGTITAIGENTHGVKIGDRVTCDAKLYCNECVYCQRGDYNLCNLAGGIGLQLNGAFAEYLNVPAYTLHQLPNTIPDDQGALIEPLAVSHHSLLQAGFKEGDNLLIMGAGPIGLGVLLLARALKAGKVFVIEPSEHRRNIASDLQCDHVIDPFNEDYKSIINNNTNDIGVDIAIDCSGVQAAFDIGLRALRKGGTLAVTAIYKEGIKVSSRQLTFGEKKIVGVIGYKESFKGVIDLLSAKAFDPSPLITTKISLDDILTKGFGELIRNNQDNIKILVAPKTYSSWISK
jgi:(R,R)-butanediol dehydrogenase / meso-butanediol dehydrogenase / diacetyl reductase